MDDETHDTDVSAYRAVFDIADHRTVELESGARVPGMILQMRAAVPYQLQFSRGQAFFNAGADGLAAGSYCVTLGAGMSSSYTPGDTVEFTLAQALPANGRLYMAPKADGGYAVSSYAAGAASPIETVSGTVNALSAAQVLGTTGQGGLNSTERMRAGSNRWKNSAVRQWLNSRGSNWFTPQEDFDLPPSHAGKRGFMTGFDETFLRAVRPIRLTTATDTLGTVDVTYDRFFLPSVQEMNVTPQVADAEGEYLAFWREAEGAGDYVGTGSGNSFECLRVKDIKTDATLTATFKVRRYKILEKYRPQIEAFLTANGEEIATKRELSIASSKVLESLDAEDAIVGLDNGLK